MSTSQPHDAIDLEVRWSRLITIMDEVDTAVVRTAFSTIVGESRDFGVIMVDQLGRSLAQSQLSTPAFTSSLPITCKHLLEACPVDILQQGDVLITNDPWLGSGHLPDLTICTPVFHKDAVVAFMGCVAHISDIGGRSDYLDSKDLFEEGLRIPPMKLVSNGIPVEPLFKLIESNVRVPRMVIGDIHAILGAERLGAERLIEFLEDYRMDNLDHLSAMILDRSEVAMARSIESLPDGSYSSVLDIDGHKGSVHIAVEVTIRGAKVRVDLTGSSEERFDAAINCVMNTTVSDTYYPFKCSLLPDLPNNEGLYRFLEVHAPLGSIFNTRFPRSVRARSKSSCHIHSAIYAALSGVMKDRVHAGSGSFWTMTAFGTHDDGEPYRSHMLPNGGKGAVPGKDGLPTIAFPYNGTITPAEVFENNSPLLIGQRRLLTDSGGPGRFRGGLGQHITFASLSDKPVGIFCRPDKTRYPAPGLMGGRPGRPGQFLLNEGLAPLIPFELKRGDLLELQLPGGGGLGPPSERNPAALARDVADGLVSRECARTEYN